MRQSQGNPAHDAHLKAYKQWLMKQPLARAEYSDRVLRALAVALGADIKSCTVTFRADEPSILTISGRVSGDAPDLNGDLASRIDFGEIVEALVPGRRLIEGGVTLMPGKEPEFTARRSLFALALAAPLAAPAATQPPGDVGDVLRDLVHEMSEEQALDILFSMIPDGAMMEHWIHPSESPRS